jgi:hypothetical protein
VASNQQRCILKDVLAKSLKGKTVAILATDGFEQSELFAAKTGAGSAEGERKAA